jgi:formate hydrogenlyase subunit 4
MKLFVLSALVLHLLVPFHIGMPVADWVLFLVEMIAMAGVIGMVESFMARLQMRHVPTLLAAASLLCGFGFVLMVR